MIHVDKVQAMAPVFTSTFILLISRSELTVAPDTSYHLWESSCTNNDISDTDTVDLHLNKIEKDELPVDWEDLWSGTRKLLHDICKNAKFVWDLLLDPGTDLGLSTGFGDLVPGPGITWQSQGGGRLVMIPSSEGGQTTAQQQYCHHTAQA